MNTLGSALSHRLRLLAILGFFVYLTFVGGSVYTDLNLGLRVFHQLLLTLLLVLWLGVLLWRKEAWPRTGLELPLALFMLWRFASSWTGINPRMSVELFWRPVVHVLLFYFLLWMMRRQGWGLWVRVYYLTAGVVCLIGLIEFVGWYVGLPFLPIFQEGWLQIGGLANPIPPTSWRLQFTLGSATSLSAFLSLLVPPALAMGLRSCRRDTRLVWFGWVAVSLVVQLLTQSRGGLLALLVSVPLFGSGMLVLRRGKAAALWARMRGNRWFWVGLLTLAIVLVLVLLKAVPFYLQRQATWDIRVEMWRCGLEMLKSRPLLGVGHGVYGQALRSCVSSHNNAYERFTTAHNLYLNLAAESGLPVLLALVWLGYALVRQVWNRWRQIKTVEERLLVMGLFSALVGYGVNCLVDTLTMTPLVLPVLVILAWLLTPAEPHPGVPRRPRLAPLLAIGVLLLFLGGLLWVDQAQWHFERSRQNAGRGELDLALDEIEQAQHIDPRLGLYEVQEAYYLGRLAAEQPEPYLAQAIGAFESALALDVTYSLHHANLALLYWQAGQQEQALRSMEQATHTNPLNTDYWLNLGWMAEEAGRQTLAIDSYSYVLSKAPHWAASDFWQASSFRDQNWQSILNGAVKLGADASRLWLSAGDFERSQEVLQGELSKTGHLLAVGRLALAQEDYEQAKWAFGSVSTNDPSSAGVYRLYAQANYALDNLEAAAQNARIALFLNPLANAPARYILGQIALENGDLAQAKEQFWQAMPPTVLSHNWEVVLYNRRASIEFLPHRVRINGGSAVFQPWLDLADLYQAEGDVDQATNIYELLLERDPYDQQVQSLLEKLK